MNCPQNCAANSLFAEGLAHQREGRPVAAQRCYENGLKISPGQPDALFLLGQLLFEGGQRSEGERLMRKAIAANPQAVNYWRGLAIQFFNCERLSDAQVAFEQAVAIAPDDAEVRGEFALALERLGEIDAAILQWEQATQAPVPPHEAWRQLARLYAATGRNAQALVAIETQLGIDPGCSADWLLRADLHERDGRTDLLLADLVQAATLAPDDAVLRGRLGVTLIRAGLGDAGLKELDAGVKLAPENASLHFNRGAAYANAGHIETACAAYENALRLDPEAPAVLSNLASQYAALARNVEAQALYVRAIAASPSFAPAHFNLGMLHLDGGRRLDAAASLAVAAELDPENGLIAAHLLFQKMHLCRWDGLDQLSRCVERAISQDSADIPPFVVLSMPGTTPQLQRRCAENHSARLIRPSPVGALEGGSKRDRERLRVAYISSDFKSHATAYLMIEMLEAHDRSRFEVIALSYGVDDGSTMRGRVAASVEKFVDLAGLSVVDVVQRVVELELDILIDLKGYTEGNHSEWLQYRFAPVQINWLGYPGTLGAPWVDYLIADAVVAPLEHQWMYRERLLHLPQSYQPNSRERSCGLRPSRADEGLPEQALVLCSFNQTYKITPEIFSVWMEVLHQVPQTVLWLWASNPWAEIELRRVAEAKGVDAQRLIFAEGRAQADHLARLPLADIALDTFPCNGHTTTSDALWAGVPVVTLRGLAFAERVAASILSAAGLEELISRTREDYLAIIVKLCNDPEALSRLRVRLSELRSTSSIFDSARFANNLEDLLINIHTLNAVASAPDFEGK
jgi:predicted O-linked N-acetylglucosamine transferase (SPINDLY family)